MMRLPAGLIVSFWLTMVLAAVGSSFVTGGMGGGTFSLIFWGIVQGAGLTYALVSQAPPSKRLTEGIAAIGLLAFVFMLFTTGIVEALMSLLLWLQAARNPGLSTRRDVCFGLAISLALIAYGAAEARDGLFLLPLAAYGLSVLTTLVYCHQHSAMSLHADTAGSAVRESKAGVSKGHLLVLIAGIFMLACLWYFLVPRPAPLHFGAIPVVGGEEYSDSQWEQEAQNGSTIDDPHAAANQPNRRHHQQSGTSGAPGNEENLDIQRSGNADHEGQQGNPVALLVQSDRSLYLRRKTFDQFRDNRWFNSDHSLGKILPQEGKFELSSHSAGQTVRYIVQVVLPASSQLPLSAHANTLEAPARVIGLSPDGTVALPVPPQPGFRYAGTSTLPANAKRPVAYDALRDGARYLKLDDGYVPRIGELAAQVTAQADSPIEMALALEAHLRKNYSYSFETVFTSQNVTPLDEFLFETRHGHCEFFASAMAVMLRSLGIPSRMVHGYLAHSYNPIIGFYEVKAFDGHAWVEAYIEGQGWVTFEPTPAYPLPRMEQQTGTVLPDLKNYLEKLAEQEKFQGKPGIKAMLASLLQGLTEAWHALVFHLHIWFAALLQWIEVHYWQITGGLTLMAGTAAAAYRLRSRLLWLWAGMAMRRTATSGIALTAFRYLERIARTGKKGRLPSETADEYLRRLGRLYPQVHHELDAIRAGFNLNRYGEKALEQEQATKIRQAFQRVSEELAIG